MPRFLLALLPNVLRDHLKRLRFPQLALVTCLLFLITLFVPDPLPFVDELLLFAGGLLLTSWRQRRQPEPTSEVAAARRPPIEGESHRVDRP
ncbi:MAG: DUF6116 family protein [Lysobacterales bacterium]|jgi:hypothetical protein